jgi:D-sedoheptulose 7-phosphate isomerase
MVDLVVMVPSDNIQRIQEGHITIGHLICEVVEQMMSQKQWQGGLHVILEG